MTLETLIPWIAGAIGVPVTNALKAWLKLSGKPALVLTAIVSVVLAVIVLAASGKLLEAENILAVGAQVLGTATLIYKLLG